MYYRFGFYGLNKFLKFLARLETIKCSLHVFEGDGFRLFHRSEARTPTSLIEQVRYQHGSLTEIILYKMINNVDNASKHSSLLSMALSDQLSSPLEL